MHKYEPLRWFWIADHGDVFDSEQSRKTDGVDVRYLKFVETGGLPTPWPRDDDGEQTDDALQAVLSPHGIRVVPLSLLEAKQALKHDIDSQAEVQRLKYITPGAGQAMTYSQKADEARRCIDAIDPDAADYPLLAAEIGITASTLVGVAQVIAAANAEWVQIGAAIEAARLSTKMAIAAAETEEAARAAAAAVVWP